MIKRLEISGVHMSVDDSLKKYVNKKIGQLDHVISRRIRSSIRAAVKLKAGRAKDMKTNTCEVILHLPQATLTAQETTVNMYAAIDVVEAKLKQQLKKYKQQHSSVRLHRRVINRVNLHFSR